MGSFPQPRRARSRPRDRLQRFLADRCASPKILAREISTPEINVTPKTAENLLAGHWPGELTLALIIRRFGEDVWRAVLLPEAAPELAELLEEEGRLREQLARTRERCRQMGAFRQRGKIGLDPVDPET